MTANLLIGFCAALAATGMFLIGAYCHEPVESAWSSLRSWCVRVHTRRVPDYGRHSGIPAPETAEARYERITAENVGVITSPSLLTPAQAVALREHADSMWQASEPFLPPSPQGENPYPPYVPAWLPVERKPTEDHPPWTGSQPVLDDDEQLPPKPCHGCGEPLPESVLDWVIGYGHFFCTVECANEWAAEQMRLEYVRSHLADAAEVTPELMQEVLAGLRALPVYGGRPELEVREADRLADVMLP